MNTIKDILKRYYRGETSLAEERFLKEEYRSGHLPEDPFLAFDAKEEPLPDELISKIRSGFSTRRQKHLRQIGVTIGSIAATALLILFLKGVFTSPVSPNLQLTDSMKRERFENALQTIGSVLDDKASSQEKILYEDNHLIIAIE